MGYGNCFGIKLVGYFPYLNLLWEGRLEGGPEGKKGLCFITSLRTVAKNISRLCESSAAAGTNRWRT